jgi:protein SCO1/2
VSAATRRGLLLFIVGLIIIVGALAFDYWRRAEGVGAPLPVAIGGPFTLVDQNGVTRHDTDFHGKLMLVYFGYTYCPDACPTALMEMSRAMDELGAKAEEVQPIFITVDPARDTVQQMKLYVANFSPRLLGLTGTPEQIAAAAHAYRVYYQKAPQAGSDDYLMDHSSFIYVMGRDGRYLAHLVSGGKPETIVAALKPYL